MKKKEKEKIVKLYLEGKSIREIAKVLSKNPTTIWLYLKKKGLTRKPYKVISSAAKKMSPELAYIIGVLQGDGHVNRNFFFLNAKDKDFVKYFSSQVEKWSGYKTSTIKEILPHTIEIKGKKYRTRKSYKVYFCGRMFMEFLLKNFKFGTNDWEVPKQIIKGSKKVKVAYLKGFFDSEGSVKKCGNMYRVSIYSKNLKGLKQLRKLLSTLNFATSFYVHKDGVGEISINKVHLIVRFSKEIGSSIKRKQKILMEIEEYYKSNRKYSVEDYQKVLEMKKMGLGSRRISKITGIPRSTVLHWLSKDRLPRSVKYDN